MPVSPAYSDSVEVIAFFLNVEEHCLAFALQIDVECVDDGAPSHRALRNESAASGIGLDEVKHRVGTVGGFFIGKIHPCAQSSVDAPRHDPKAHVRRHETMAASADYRTGLYGVEPKEASFEVRAGTA